MTRRLTAWALALSCVASAHAQSSAGREHWVATWGTAQQLFRSPSPQGGSGAATPPPQTASGAVPSPQSGSGAAGPPVPQSGSGAPGPARRFPIPPALRTIDNQTVRMIARTSIGGRQVRVRLTSALGGAAVRLGAAHIAIRLRDSEIVPASDRTLTFGGAPAATLYAGAVLVSDPVSLDLPPLTDVAVSLYFPGETGPPTSHLFGLRPTYISQAGDSTSQPSMGGATTTQSYYWLAGIDVLAPADAGTLVTFGDSITDGDQSTPDTIGMWPALLAARLQANRTTAHVGVVNAGISGNRVLGDNTSGLARLAHDALSVPGVAWITLLEGINDITGRSRPNATAPPITPDELIGAYRQMIEIAHMHGVKIIGCTLTPYGGSNAATEYGETVRDAVNRWIRTSGAFDAVIDFDRATRDAENPKRFRPEVDSPDLLHPANPGYKLMAEAVDLSIFTAKR